jgi:hypothetical protein
MVHCILVVLRLCCLQQAPTHSIILGTVSGAQNSRQLPQVQNNNWTDMMLGVGKKTYFGSWSPFIRLYSPRQKKTYILWELVPNCTLRDGLLFSSPYYFGSWQKNMDGKQNLRYFWRCSKEGFLAFLFEDLFYDDRDPFFLFAFCWLPIYATLFSLLYR